ncbi:MAG: DUF3618 domain-containing protein [Corynebacterium sp.]|uniref:DUF3618 domain-containing protein n=1 Tax=Corynebacterium sp. TaxID=1720 RepID=UPI002711ACE0|nr:DUF3618 domain-containing protein [Corynebacterium sp.]
MARNIDEIQRDIARSRSQLANTLDELANRTKPANLAEDAKQGVVSKLQDPTVQKVLAGIGVAVAGVIALSVARGRKRKNDIKEIQKMLAERSF